MVDLQDRDTHQHKIRTGYALVQPLAKTTHVKHTGTFTMPEFYLRPAPSVSSSSCCCHGSGTLATVPGGRHHGSYSRGGGGMELRWTGRETPAYDVKGVQSHTHTRSHAHTLAHTHTRRGRGRPADCQFPTVYWRKPKPISHTGPSVQQSYRDVCLFLYSVFFLRGTQTERIYIFKKKKYPEHLVKGKRKTRGGREKRSSRFVRKTLMPN